MVTFLILYCHSPLHHHRFLLLLFSYNSFADHYQPVDVVSKLCEETFFIFISLLFFLFFSKLKLFFRVLLTHSLYSPLSLLLLPLLLKKEPIFLTYIRMYKHIYYYMENVAATASPINRNLMNCRE